MNIISSRKPICSMAKFNILNPLFTMGGPYGGIICRNELTADQALKPTTSHIWCNPAHLSSNTMTNMLPH